MHHASLLKRDKCSTSLVHAGLHGSCRRQKLPASMVSRGDLDIPRFPRDPLPSPKRGNAVMRGMLHATVYPRCLLLSLVASKPTLSVAGRSPLTCAVSAIKNQESARQGSRTSGKATCDTSPRGRAAVSVVHGPCAPSRCGHLNYVLPDKRRSIESTVIG